MLARGVVLQQGGIAAPHGVLPTILWPLLCNFYRYIVTKKFTQMGLALFSVLIMEKESLG